MHRHSHRAGERAKPVRHLRVGGVRGIEQDAHDLCFGHDRALEFQHFRQHILVQGRHPGGVAARPREALDETGPHRIVDRHHDDRQRRHEGLRRADRGDRADQDHARAGLGQFARQVRKAPISSGRKAPFHDVIAALDQAVAAQALIDVGDPDLGRERVRRAREKQPDADRCLLRTRNKRPCHGGDTKKCVEVAPPHSASPERCTLMQCAYDSTRLARSP